MKDQGEQVVIGLSHEGFALGARPLITPLRATLFVLAAIVGGFGLSLILGTSAAHAAEGDGISSPDGGALGVATSLVTDAVAPVTTVTGPTPASQAVGSAVESTVAAVGSTAESTVQSTAKAAGTTVTALAPMASPIVQPVLSGLTGALTGAQLLLAPLHSVPSAVVIATTGLAIGAVSSAAIMADPASGTAAGLVPFIGDRGADGTLPGPLLTSSIGGPAAGLGALFLVLALALLAARRRLDDDALPPSPVFETDTSPA